MQRRWKILLVGVGFLAVLGAGLAGWGWYYTRHAWPTDIQQRLFGEQLVDASILLSHEGGAAWGEGMWRWTYRVSPKNTRISQYCGSRTLEVCLRRNYRFGNKDVMLQSSYSNGFLRFEEWWL